MVVIGDVFVDCICERAQSFLIVGEASSLLIALVGELGNEFVAIFIGELFTDCRPAC